MDFSGEKSNPNKSTPYKVRIYSQAFVYQRRSQPKQEMQRTDFGIDVPVLNWYDEYECKQLAVNHNAVYIHKDQVERLLKELNEAVMQSMHDKGLIIV